MYSYEDRLRAVRLYIKMGKPIGLTIRSWAISTKNALKTWCLEYEQLDDLPAGYTRPAKFSESQKERAVQHYLEHGRCIAATFRALGYPSRSLLSAWLQQLDPQKRPRVVGRSQQVAPEAKQAAVIALCTRQARAQAVADEAGVSRCSLYEWKNQLDAAIEKVAISDRRAVVHSDRGGHYRWPGWLTRIADTKAVRSMSRNGCSPDNAACEGFFCRLKTEMFFARDWLSTTIEEIVAALDAYIHWYNEVRIKSSLGFRSPAGHRRRLGIAA